jgi:eukaryotic-like serine/threonine-protein kinase
VADPSAEHWRAVRLDFDRALEQAPGDRKAWLDALRAKDPDLAADVEALLADHAIVERERFLETPPVAPEPPSLAGQPIGAYTLVSPIGQGGMGSVWLARRSDGRYEGTAAVKLLNVSLIGRAGEERFRREGSILARLTHPHIAHLVDAGVSPNGQPYMVLEHVEGEPIDRYCDTRSLGVRARLRVVLDVLEAVAHAHKNLIVHRDIKPSNVLVGTDGRVKLLDFGIAKLLDDEASPGEATALTREGSRALTPAYAAPEQVAGGVVTTSTDVFALGTLLYVILAGRHPAESALTSPVLLLKAIVESDPKPPSEAVTAADATTRGATRDGLSRLLKGDLDTIVAKALKKNPTERYATVTALGEDIGRYLAREPIRARPDTALYRTTKFIERNRATVGLAALALIALCAGLAGTLLQAKRATRQAALADEERERADEAAREATVQRDFALSQLSRADAINDLNAFLLSEAAPSGRPFTARDLLERAERIVDRQTGDTDENRAEMLVAIGSLYGARDEEAKAREVLGKAYEISRKTSDRSIRAKAACALAGEVAAAGDFDRGESLIRDALGELGDAPQFALLRVSCLLRGSYVANESGDSPAAIERARTAQRVLTESRQRSPLMELRVSVDLAEAYRMAGRDREAAAAFEDAFARLTSLGRDETEQAGTLLNNWGLALQILGRPLEAERLFRRAVAIGSADAAERGVSPMLLNNLARTLGELYRFPEATRYAERAYTEARKAGDEIVVNQALSVRFNLCIDERDFPCARTILSELEPRWRGMMPRANIAFAILSIHKARLASGEGDHETAVAEADHAIALAENNPQGPSYLSTLLLRRAGVNLEAGRLETAENDARRALAMEESATEPGELYSGVGRAYLVLGRALKARGRADESRAAFASALRHLEPSLGEDHPMTREARLSAAADSR